MVVRVHAAEHAVGMVLPDRLRRGAERQRGGDLHLGEEPVLQRLLVESHVVAAPERGHEQVWLGPQRLGDVRREIGGEELRPRLGDVLRLGQDLLRHDAEVIEAVAAVRVVGMDVRDLLDVGPGHGHAQGAGRSVGRLDVGDAEDVARVGDRLVEEEVGAAVDEDGEQLQLLRHGTQRGRIAAGGDPHEHVDLLGELEAAHLLGVGVGPGRLVGLEDLDLPLAEKAALLVDLVGSQQVALVHRLAEDRAGAGEEGHVADLERLVRDGALRFLLCVGHARAQTHHRASDRCHCTDSKLRKKIPPRRSIGHVSPAGSAGVCD